MVYIHLATGFEEIEAVAVADVLRRAGIRAAFVSMTDDYYVKSVHDVIIKADVLFDDVDYSECEMLVLPGGGPGTENLKKHKGLAKKIFSFDADEKWIAAICAAPTIFGMLGILDGREVTCYPGCEGEMRDGYIVDHHKVVVCDNLITSKGPGTAIEFGLKLVEVLKGEQEAKAIAKDMIA